MALPKMLTLREASAASGLSYCHLRNLCLEGTVYCVRAGKKWLINKDSLAAYLGGTSGGED